MDAALRFQAFRRVCIDDPDDPSSASTIFNHAGEEITEPLDLNAEQITSLAPAVEAEARIASTEGRSIAGERAGTGETPPASQQSPSWSTFAKKGLKSLLDLAELDDQLKNIAAAIDRHVRNALAHGVPQLVPDSQQIRFDDQGTILTWTLQEFFENTRRLTLTVCAMSEFVPILQLQQTRGMLRYLWGGRDLDASGSAS